MGRPFRDLWSLALAAALAAGCALSETVQRTEGQLVLRAGGGPAGPSGAAIPPGPALRHIVILVPGVQPAWQVEWVDTGTSAKRPGGGGTYAGFLAGLLAVQSAPYLLAFWPAALGVVAGSTAMGALGAQRDSTTFSRMAADDRETIARTAPELRPDYLLRERTAALLAARTGRALRRLAWYPTYGPDTPGTNPLADARGEGAEGVLSVWLEAFGLAMGEEQESLGVFARARAQLVDAVGGGLRYERVLEYGPGRPLPGLPRPAAHTLEFLALDEARVFRHEMQELIGRMAGLLAADPALPVAAR